MAALLAGARLVLRQGVRFFPAYRLHPTCVPVRCLSMSPRFLTPVVEENTADSELVLPWSNIKSALWAKHEVGKNLKQRSRISKELFLASLEKLNNADMQIDSQTWLLLQACGHQMPSVLPEERMEFAITLWNKMKEMGIKPDEYHYNILLRKYLENEHKFSPTEFLAEMEAANLTPNLSTYELLIEAYCVNGDIEGASKILAHLKSLKFPITEDVFCSLIRGHARAGDMESAENIQLIMKESDLKPGRYSYLALLHAYAEKGDLENMQKIRNQYSLHIKSPEYTSLIYAFVKYGNDERLEEFFDRVPPGNMFIYDVVNLCLMLLTQGYGDAALLVTKMLITANNKESYFDLQPCNFFIRHCVYLNLPVETIVKYANELQKCNLHRSPLEFALLCALEGKKKDIAFELLKTMHEATIPIKEHYYWPLLASFTNEEDIKGGLQFLKQLFIMNLTPALSCFHMYVRDWFMDAQTKILLEDLNFTQDFNLLYGRSLRQELYSNSFSMVYKTLSSNIPYFVEKGTTNVLSKKILGQNISNIAKITKLLSDDRFWLDNPPHQSASDGRLLYFLIESMTRLNKKPQKEHLQQYFQELKELGVTIGSQNAQQICNMLKSCGEELGDLAKYVMVMIDKDSAFLSVDEKIQCVSSQGEPAVKDLLAILNDYMVEKNRDKIMEFTEKFGCHFTFGMYMKILRFCCEGNYPEQALKLKKVIDQRGFFEIPSVDKYMDLFQVLALNGFKEDAVNVLKEMHERQVIVKQDSKNKFFRILNNVAKTGDVDAVNQIFDHIVSLNFSQPSTDLCSSLVKVHIERNELSLALKVMKECELKYNCCPMEYITLVKIVEAGDTELLKTAVDMINDIFGERQLLHSLLFAFIENRKYEEAKRIAETPGLRAIPKKIKWVFGRFARSNKVKEMEKSLEITQGLFDCDRREMYSLLLEVYESEKKLSKVVKVWYKMKEEAIYMNERTIQLFENIFKNAGQDITTHIPEFLQEKNSQKLEDEETTSYKIENLCLKHLHEDAHNIFLEAEEQNEILLKSTYARLSRCLMSAGQYENACKVDEAAKRHYRYYTVDNLFLNHLLALQVKRDCLKDALLTLKVILKNGYMPKDSLLERIFEHLSKKGDTASLIELEELINVLQYTNDRVGKSLLDSKLLSLFTSDNDEEAISMIESVVTKNPNTSLIYLASMLIRNNMKQALEKLIIVTEMLANKMSIYQPITHLFIAYVETEQLQEAKQLLERCNAILEQTDVLMQRIDLLISRNRTNKVMKLINILSDPVFKDTGYNHLMNHFIFHRKLGDAMDLYSRMTKEQINVEDAQLKLLANLLREKGRHVPFPEPQ